SGLGLSIVKRTAMAFGGDVTLKSLPGKGSTFKLRLPLAPEAS
ncbi:MAG TPA: ATP-binding protein, partial [Acidobacteriota bacterium]|nr:ATP-binding protein [Acidobacteriota bacterium]